MTEQDIKTEIPFEFSFEDSSDVPKDEYKKCEPKHKKNPETFIRVSTTFPIELKKRMDDYIKKNHIHATTKFIQDAVNYYLTAMEGTSMDQHILGQDASVEIKRALEPITEENKRRDRTTKILLNAIWHMLQINSNIDENTLEQIVTRAVREIDNAGNSFTANEILDGAIAEKNAAHNFYNSTPEKNVTHNSVNSEQKNFAERKNYASYFGTSHTQAPSYDNSRFNQYSDSSDRSKQKQSNEADSDPLLNYDS